LLFCKILNLEYFLTYVNWFDSYLNNRHVHVRVLGTLCSSHAIMSGIPQAPALEHLLFITFINDIRGSILIQTISCFPVLVKCIVVYIVLMIEKPLQRDIDRSEVTYESKH
jgi:hypothetical protein